MPLSDRTQLLSRWISLCSSLRLRDAERVFDRLYALYTAPERHYHDIHHISASLRELDAVRHQAQNPDAIELAIWFHDCIYDPRTLDNEHRSAEVSRQHLTHMGASASLIATVEQLILATQHNAPPSTPDAALLVDIDLIPLAAPPEVFDANGRAIRAEYAHLDEHSYAEGRSAILARFLSRPRIYFTDVFGRRYESPARSNLARTLNQ